MRSTTRPTRTLPGDDLLAQPDLVSTRATRIDAPSSAVWPWLAQMGSGRGGVYTYDWIENLFGLQMHSVDVVLPQISKTSPSAMHRNWARTGLSYVSPWSSARTLWCSVLTTRQLGLGILPRGRRDRDRLISRNRIATPRASWPARAFYRYLMEPGSLLMERKTFARHQAAGRTSGGNRASRGRTVTFSERFVRRVRLGGLGRSPRLVCANRYQEKGEQTWAVRKASKGQTATEGRTGDCSLGSLHGSASSGRWRAVPAMVILLTVSAGVTGQSAAGAAYSGHRAPPDRRSTALVMSRLTAPTCGSPTDNGDSVTELAASSGALVKVDHRLGLRVRLPDAISSDGTHGGRQRRR